MKKLEATVNFIKNQISKNYNIGIILGSGLGDLIEKIKVDKIIAYKDIPNFPYSTVEGHKGQLVFGELSGKKVIAMQGRFHYYEGYSLQQTTFPVRVLAKLGIDKLIVTNAAGGINKNFHPGDLMIIEDHINFTGKNPLIGKNNEKQGDRFPDMSQAYDREYISKVERIGQSLDINLKKGVYIWFTGPNYETPSEIKMARILGADAVGMSTVPEVIVARHQNIKVLGISCITNMASGVLDETLSHADVIKTSIKAKSKLERIVIEFISQC